MTGTAGSGTSGAGGSAGMMGSAGSSSGAVTQLYAFASSLEGFTINRYCTGPAANEACTDVQAQAPAAAADAGTDAGDSADATTPATPPPASDFYTLAQDGTVGEAAPGSAKVTLNFTTGTQSANFAINFSTGVDLTGKTVRAQVRIEPGAPSTTYAKMYLKTGVGYYYADSGQVTLIPGTWIPVSFATTAPPSYPMPVDATLYLLGDVREIGMELAATGIAAAATAEIHIDTISY
jgi:hypothetical protein